MLDQRNVKILLDYVKRTLEKEALKKELKKDKMFDGRKSKGIWSGKKRKHR